jgi:LmbE family N-acetylglucosaminyl deacetylase
VCSVTDQPSNDTWTTRELPVLKYVCAVLDIEETLSTRDIDASSIGISKDDLVRALRALDEEYLVIKWYQPHPLLGPPDIISRNEGTIIAITGAARREVGMWPTAERITERLLATLEEQIESSGDDPDKRSKLIKIRDAILSAGRDLVVDIVGSAASKAITGS